MIWFHRAGRLALALVLSALSMSTVAASVAAAADTPPSLVVTGTASCSPQPVGDVTAYFTVSQGSGGSGTFSKFSSVQASPVSIVYGEPGPLPSGTLSIFRVPMSTATAAWANFRETLTVTAIFDMPDGTTASIDGSGTVTLPLCPATIEPDADSFVQHCDRSVDAYVVYNPGYTAAATTITFWGRGYTGIAPYDSMSVDVTVSPGQTAHAFFPADHAYVITIDEAHEPTQYGASPYYSDVPAGCPYFPPPGSPGSQSSGPPTVTTSAGQTSTPVATTAHAGSPVAGGPVAGGPAAGGVGDVPVSGAPTTVVEVAAAGESSGATAAPTVGSRRPAPPVVASEPSQAADVGPWPAIGAAAGLAMVVALTVVIAVRRRVHRLTGASAGETAPAPGDPPEPGRSA